MPSLPHTIPGTVRAFNDHSATIEISSGVSFDVPRAMLATTIAIGSTVHLAIFSDADVATEHERLAKVVLAELMRGT